MLLPQQVTVVAALAADLVVPPGTPWWLAILLVVVPAVGTWVVARGPVWLENAKQRREAKTADEPKPLHPKREPKAIKSGAHAEARADAALDLVDQSLRDAWTTRDAAIRRADRLQHELDDEQDKNAEQAVTIAELRAAARVREGRRDRDTG